MKALGHVFKYGDNVDTDVIIPARYLNSFDGKELKLEDTEILYDLLPEEDQANFNKGIILEEYEQLASLLQDFEG